MGTDVCYQHSPFVGYPPILTPDHTRVLLDELVQGMPEPGVTPPSEVMKKRLLDSPQQLGLLGLFMSGLQVRSSPAFFLSKGWMEAVACQ